jgi:transcriptional regulator with XRE-family HTH domain
VTDGKRSDEERAVLRAWGEILRRYRQWGHLSRRELALRAGVSPVFLGEIERGEKDCSVHTVCLLAEALEISLAELYIRVAMRLNVPPGPARDAEQTALPRVLRESNSVPDGVGVASDETAYDVYTIVRELPAQQQLSLLILARTFQAGRS